jgi:hypothetical protein
MLPWWAIIYLSFLSLLTLAGIIEEYKAGSKLHPLATLISLTSSLVLVYAFFDPEFTQLLGIYSLLLLGFTLLYDFYISSKNLDLKPSKFWQSQGLVRSRIDWLTATIIVAPAYIAGIVVAYRVLLPLV